jgi:hypothetical protein
MQAPAFPDACRPYKECAAAAQQQSYPSLQQQLATAHATYPHHHLTLEPTHTACCCCCIHMCRWYVPASAGPSEDGPSTQLWMYRSTVDVVRDTQAGLAGPLVIARPGTLNAEGKPTDVDKEIYMMLQVRLLLLLLLAGMACSSSPAAASIDSSNNPLTTALDPHSCLTRIKYHSNITEVTCYICLTCMLCTSCRCSTRSTAPSTRPTPSRMPRPWQSSVRRMLQRQT